MAPIVTSSAPAETATKAAVVDPGAEAPAIRHALGRVGAACAGILLTHSHYDHIGALAELAEETGAPVWLPRARWTSSGGRTTSSRLGVSLRGYDGEATLLAGGETVEAAGIAFEVTAVPGHSPGHVAYYADGHLFSGDVLFSGSVGRTDLPFGDWDTLLGSIRTLVDAYPPETIVHSGHGPQTTLGDEVARNPFLAELRASMRLEPPRGTHDIMPAGAAALAARHGRDGAALRPLRLPADPDAGVRGHRPLPAHVG